jgi:hypothetical protein
MILVRAELQSNLANALCRHFACECGATDEDIVAERTGVRATGFVSQAAKQAA